MLKRPTDYSVKEIVEIINIPLKVYAGDIETNNVDEIFTGIILSYTPTNIGEPKVFSLRIKKENNNIKVYNILELRKFERINNLKT
jgi:hypothetical protein